ncbi:hypothetical protein PBRA_001870 [Plasmodiophora brassicae]|uniref:Uncharacterized protein n=1 Tax=Plasmodiophora brassicae TaxID=37360 RepID=A0A0G4J1Q8_PLABS|nr:hypothetical protein PBRA_001870 [Plasmodiophora brassicae]
MPNTSNWCAATGTPGAGRGPLAACAGKGIHAYQVLAFTFCCAASPVTFTAAGDRTMNAHQLKIYVRQLHPQFNVVGIMEGHRGTADVGAHSMPPASQRRMVLATIGGTGYGLGCP